MFIPIAQLRCLSHKERGGNVFVTGAIGLFPVSTTAKNNTNRLGRQRRPQGRLEGTLRFLQQGCME